jgi:hypothetical protein
MGKLTKAQRRDLESIAASLDRFFRWIESDSIALCRAGKINDAAAHYGDGSPGHEFRAASPFETKHHKGRDDSEWQISWIRTLSPISKGVGSDLMAAYTARSIVNRMLES